MAPIGREHVDTVRPARLRSWLGGARERVRRIVRARSLVILRRRLDGAIEAPSDVELRERGAGDPAVGSLYRSFDREAREDLFAARFRHGLRFFELSDGREPLAAMFVVGGGQRYLNEAGLGLLLPDGDLWLRDVFVRADRRRQGLFAKLVDAVVARHYPRAAAIWSDVSVRNPASLRAHQRYGFQAVDSLEAVRVAGLLMLRLRMPRSLPLGASYAPGRRVFFTGPAFRRFDRDATA